MPSGAQSESIAPVHQSAPSPKWGALADSAEGRASTLTACGEVSIPGEELHTWSLWPPPPLAPAAPGPFLHPSFLSISLFFLSFFSLLIFSLLTLITTAPYSVLSSPLVCPLFIVDLHAASGLCLPLPLSLRFFVCWTLSISLPL